MKNFGWLSIALAAGSMATIACGHVMEPGAPGNLVPQTVAEDPGLPAIDMNGSRFHLETFGNPAKPVVVFLHGGPGSDYRSLLRLAERHGGYSLADDYYLVFWDQRGTGLSKRLDHNEVSIDRYVEDLDSLISRYSPNRPVYLVGHSWGGMYATRYINAFPKRVAGAVLIEPGPLEGKTMERLKGKIQDFVLGSEVLNDMAWGIQFLSPDDHARMDYERLLGVRDGEPKYHLSKSDPEPAWRLGAAAARWLMEDGQDAHGVFNYDFTTKLAAYTTPVLFVTGSESEVLGESLQREQVLRYPSATLTVVPSAGHDVPWVKAAEVSSLIRAYLAARTGDRQ